MSITRKKKESTSTGTMRKISLPPQGSMKEEQLSLQEKEYGKQKNGLRKNAERKLNVLKNSLKLKSTIDCIGYDYMMDDGICIVKPGLYSRTLRFSDVNYLSIEEDKRVSIFERYCQLLNECDSATQLEVTLTNSYIDTDSYNASMMLPLKGDRKDKYRKELNEMYADKIHQGGKNNVIRQKYLSVIVEESSYESSISTLNRLEEDFKSKLEDIGCRVDPMNGTQRLELLYNSFWPGDKFDFVYDKLVETNLGTKAFIAPKSFQFEKDYFSFNDRVGRILFIQDLPVQMRDKFVSDISYIPIEMTFSIHIKRIEKESAIEKVKTRIDWIENEIGAREDKATFEKRSIERAVPLETRKSYKEALRLLERLETQDEEMFVVSMFIYTHAEDEKELKENTAKIQAIGRKNGVRINSLDFRQKEGLMAVLPIGNNPTDVGRTLTTTSTAVFIPFSDQELFQLSGQYYGQTPFSKSIIKYDRRKAADPNGLILGQPGSGKGVVIKKQIFEIVLGDNNDDVIIVDHDKEYVEMVKELDGEVISLFPGSPHHINPLDISLNYAKKDRKDTTNPLALKVPYIFSLYAVLKKDEITAVECSIIDRACTLIYEGFFKNPYNAKMPTLKDLLECIAEQPETVAKEVIVPTLEYYIKGTMSAFSHETNVDTENSLIVFDILDLGTELKDLGMLVVLDQIWNRITKNRQEGKRTWLIIDELQFLLQHKRSATYLFELWSRARKWGCIPTGITQNLQNMFVSEESRGMLATSDFMIILRLSPSEADELGELLRLNPDVIEKIRKSKVGHGFLSINKNLIPFYDEFPKDTEIYDLISTNPDEENLKYRRI